MVTYMKLSKAQLSKIIQLGRFLGILLGKLAGPLVKVVVPLAKNALVPLATMASASTIEGAIQRKMHGRGVVGAGKRIHFSHVNEDVNGILESKNH